MVKAKPHKLLIRAYDVGFGDCFLLTFQYQGSTGERHMLIDFGSTERPPKAPKDLMRAVAGDIKKVCNGKLHIIVATHRHKDHISGFATNKKGNGPGDIIRTLNPDLVIQPWTEDRSKPHDWQGTGQALKQAGNFALQHALDSMNVFAEACHREAALASRAVRGAIASIAEEGLANMPAIENLSKMATNEYVYHGAKVPQLKKLLPGVDVSIIGPPTIKQKAGITTQRPKHESEFWNFASFWRLQAHSADLMGNGDALFPGAEVLTSRPLEMQWFIRRVRRLRDEQLLGIVRAMDDALNNTSVILLIKAGRKKLLFPGDAQWENWEYALNRNTQDLNDVDLYKVGHHGSLNATPKTLWKLFEKKSTDKDQQDRLWTLMSTVTDSKHGHDEKGTEVPRKKLVAELVKNSHLYTTQEIEGSGKVVGPPLELDLT